MDEDEEELRRLLEQYAAMGGTEDLSGLSVDDIYSRIADMNFAKTGMAVPSPATGLINPGSMSDEELRRIIADPMEQVNPYQDPNAEVATEMAMREASAGRSFVQNLTDPKTMAWAASRMAKLAAAGTMNTFDIPAQLAGMYGLGSLGAEQLANMLAPVEPVPSDPVTGEQRGHDFGSSAALDFANDRYMESLEAAGVSPPREVGESLAGIAGMMIPIPGVKVTGPVANMAEFVTPFVMGDNLAPRLAINMGASGTIDQGTRELFADDETYQTAFDLLGVPDVDPDQVDGIALSTLAAGATLPLWGPVAVQSALRMRKPKLTVKKISDLDKMGPENVWTATTAGDVSMSTAVDDIGALERILDRVGIPNYDEVTRQLDMDTQAAGMTRVNEALNSGSMHTVHGDFTVPVAPKHLRDMYDTMPDVVQTEVNKYLMFGDYIDTIRRRQAAGIAQPTDARELARLQGARRQMRATHPMLASFSKSYQEYTEGVRSYLTKGEYAMMTPQMKLTLDREQPHYVPLEMDPVKHSDGLLKRIRDANRSHLYSDELSWLQTRDIKEINFKTIPNRYDAIPEAMSYGHSALTAQLHNNARGAVVDALLQSPISLGGKPLIRKATTKEVDRFPERITRVWRKGKEEYYISDQLIATTLRFDPAILSNPGQVLAYAQRRLFEQGTTGALTVATSPFSIVTAIRDTIAGAALAGKGQKGPGIGTLWAPARILGPKLTKVLSDDIMARLDTGGMAWYLPGMDKASQRQLSGRLANTYQNSMYHMSREAGGVDASIMDERYVVAKGALEEVARTIKDKAPWVSRTYNRTMAPMLAGVAAVFDALNQAPRMDAFIRNVRSGISAEQAARHAKTITGNTRRSGRAFDNQGRRITGDVVNPEIDLLTNPLLAYLAGGARVAIPFVNPTIQGSRRVMQAAGDPFRFAMRNWTFVGMPAVAAYAWNNMLSKDNDEGYDYQDYAFNKRASRDQVMEMYFGLPGLPPERGISIPIAHESTPFMAPFQTLLRHMGGTGPEMTDAITQTGLTILENVAGIGMPPAAASLFSIAGYKAPESIMAPWRNTYDIREDNVGIASENIEQAIRSQFGSLGATGLAVAAAFMDDAEVQDALAEWGNQIMGRTPIAKGLGGWKINSSSFTPMSQQQRKKLDAYNTFLESYDEYFQHEGTVSEDAPAPFFPLENGEQAYVPFSKAGAEPLARPINPLYEMIGGEVRNAFERKDPYGYKTTEAQMKALTRQIQLLRGFNEGRKDDFQKMQELLEVTPEEQAAATAVVEEAQAAYDAFKSDNGGPGVTGNPDAIPAKDALEAAKDQETRLQSDAELKQFLEDNDIDLSNRFDVVRLTNLLEGRRVDLMKYQLEIINEIEDDMTKELQAQGMMGPEDHFSIEKHLAPMADPTGAWSPLPKQPSPL